MCGHFYPSSQRRIHTGSNMPTSVKNRPKYYDLNLLNLPIAGRVSIFHRVTGVVMFLFMIPLMLFLLQATLKSESGFNFWRNVINFPLVKLVLVGLIWSFMHHFFAGIRYLLLDLHIGVEKAPARTSAIWVFVLGAISTILIAVRIW
jgi:succinate dehydrogenase / fumarate reductase, cytochrome b subunit